MPADFRATYRLQLHSGFTFDDAGAIVPYLARLGVSHLYLSPITQARPGSTHGYDVIDHNAVDDALGGREGFDRLLETVRAHGMGVVLDFVPNHAGVGTDNAAWQDVLAYGPGSPSARLFDIDWRPLKPELDGKVLLPFLGKTYGEALDGGELIVTYDDGRFCLGYYDNRFALNPASYHDLFAAALPRYDRQDVYFDFKDLVEAYATLEPAERDKAETLRLRLLALGDRIDFAEAATFCAGDDLHLLLEKQFWRLSYWKTAGHEINYRRFFDINGLAALRMEDERVFWQAHRLLGELLTLDGVDGVRLDHIDGLFDPHEYLERLRELGAAHQWVEKIRGHGEVIPDAWPVEGTTGYRFMNDAAGLFIDPAGEEPLTRLYHRFVPDALPFAEEAYQSKKLVMESSLSSELFRLAYELDGISEADYHTRDFTFEALRDALVEVIAALDRYRTYLPYEVAESRGVIRHAIERAIRRNPAGERSVFSFIEHMLTEPLPDMLREQQRRWIGRFQQYTAPVAAKGVEDTAFYRHVRLAALNEVGGEPDRFGVPPEALHARARYRANRVPRSLLATATHDHKRGEDTRLRLVALSEMPDEWADVVEALREIGLDHCGPEPPLRSDQYLFFQTLVALWPGQDPTVLTERLVAYAQKAARESKLRTSWLNLDEGYEQGLEAFVRGVTGDPRTKAAVEALAARLARCGFHHTLSQIVLKLTQPGLPDFYQGTELLDLSLVDPDNRKPVDFAARAHLLGELESLLDTPDVRALSERVERQDASAKLYVIACLLRLHAERPDLFAGGYRALAMEGPEGDQWFAFARTTEDDTAVAVVPRFANRPGSDGTLPLPGVAATQRWRNVLTGEAHTGHRLPLAAAFPWAVWVAER